MSSSAGKYFGRRWKIQESLKFGVYWQAQATKFDVAIDDDGGRDDDDVDDACMSLDILCT